MVATVTVKNAAALEQVAAFWLHNANQPTNSCRRNERASLASAGNKHSAGRAISICVTARPGKTSPVWCRLLRCAVLLHTSGSSFSPHDVSPVAVVGAGVANMRRKWRHSKCW